MRWIVSADKDISVSIEQLNKRHRFIESVTGQEVTKWSIIPILQNKYFCCFSDDTINGTFITAHIGQVFDLCSNKEIAQGDLVIANTCIWEKSSEKALLYKMMAVNRNIELWFAKQTLSVENNYFLRQSTTLREFGRFGFQTSLSERQLFSNRKKGFMEAVKVSFQKISPVILAGD